MLDVQLLLYVELSFAYNKTTLFQVYSLGNNLFDCKLKEGYGKDVDITFSLKKEVQNMIIDLSDSQWNENQKQIFIQ